MGLLFYMKNANNSGQSTEKSRDYVSGRKSEFEKNKIVKLQKSFRTLATVLCAEERIRSTLNAGPAGTLLGRSGTAECALHRH